jgi:hypothetical protein
MSTHGRDLFSVATIRISCAVAATTEAIAASFKNAQAEDPNQGVKKSEKSPLQWA